MTSQLAGWWGWVEDLSVYYTQKFAKIAMVHTTAWHFSMKTWLKLNLLHKFFKRAWTKLYTALENFKIPLVLRQI
jgi:hypothetical protein